jgi:hypothetical protein
MAGAKTTCHPLEVKTQFLLAPTCTYTRSESEPCSGMVSSSILRKIALFAIGGAILACAAGQDGTNGKDGTSGADGKDGKDGTILDPSASLIVPNVGLLDRELDVQLNLDSVKMTTVPALDFGPGVTVDKPYLASETAVHAHLVVDPKAIIGTRDVKITADGRDLIAKKSFTVSSPVTASVIGGKLEQGGIAMLQIQNHDAHAFDPRLLRIGGAGFFIQGSESVTATDALLLVRVEPSARPGFAGFKLDNSNEQILSFWGNPEELEIAQRSAAPIELKGSITDKLAKNFDSRVYKIVVPPSESAVATVNLQVDVGSTFQGDVRILPSTGKDGDVLLRLQAPLDPQKGTPLVPYPLSASIPVVASSTPTELIVWLMDGKGSGSQNHNFKITSTVSPATLVPELTTGSHADATSAQSLDIGGFTDDDEPCLVDAEFTDRDQVDVYKFSVPDPKPPATRTKVELHMVTQFDTGYAISDSAAPVPVDQVAAKIVQARRAMTGTFNMTSGVHYFSVTRGKGSKTPSGKYVFSIRPL